VKKILRVHELLPSGSLESLWDGTRFIIRVGARSLDFQGDRVVPCGAMWATGGNWVWRAGP
jgi:hypothetical protein